MTGALTPNPPVTHHAGDDLRPMLVNVTGDSGMKFDPDALLAAMPRREIRSIPGNVRIVATRARPGPAQSSLGEHGEYNGFTHRERYRIAGLSNWLAAIGATVRPATCAICGGPGKHEHAENYYDLRSWVGMCASCHVHALHRRFDQPDKWRTLLDRYELPSTHWARLVAMRPFDLARHVRLRGQQEPRREDFLA